MENEKTAYEMFARSRNFFLEGREKPAIIFEGSPGGEGNKILSYGELDCEIDVLARGLANSGVVKGDKVCLCLPNSPTLVAAYLALSKLGAVSVMLNAALPEEEIEKNMKATCAKILLDEISLGNIYLNSHSLTAHLSGGKSSLGAENTATVLYSSGTTGEQKGVELSVRNISENVRYASALTGMRPNDRLFCFVPLTHCFGLNFIMTACFYTGATLVLHEKFEPAQILDSLVKNQVSMFFGVPAVYNLFLKQKTEQFYFSSVRYFFYAADSLSKKSVLAWEKEYGRRIYTGWGLTETSPFATSNDSINYKLGSVGKSIPGVDLRIESEEGCGEVFVRGHNVMKGYLNKPEETAKAIDTDGWFRTGDIGYMDDDGYLFIVDRAKDMINVGGEKVWPAEVEKKILEHPAVLEAAVIGIQHDIMGEVPKAFIALKDKRATKKDMQEFLEPLLTKNQFPRQIEFIDKLPRNPSGKILKKELRSQKSF